jgi:ABC-type lipoprotein export system ATPase subunit
MEELVLEIRDMSNGILKDVNLEVEKGAFFVVLAPSGSGKSTLLESICRSRAIASGHIRINGVDITSINNFDKWKAANIGFIYEENNLITTLNAYDNVELPLLAAKVAKEERRTRVLKALDSVGLKEKAGVYPKKFTMEEEQRLALARAIATDPTIILADEPTGKLPKEQTERLIGLMGELNQKTGIAFMVASHDYSLKNAASKVMELSQ